MRGEGILEKPVIVEVAKALTKGDDCCEPAIHLPDRMKWIIERYPERTQLSSVMLGTSLLKMPRFA